jgi:hypothetical protein
VVVAVLVEALVVAVARAAYLNQQFICLLTQQLRLVQAVLAVAHQQLLLVHRQVLTTRHAP